VIRKISLLFFSALLLTALHLEGAPVQLKCLTFNVWHGGRQVSNGMEAIADVIAEVKPDVVCFVETKYANWNSDLNKILKKKGLKYYHDEFSSIDVSFFSKYPIKSMSKIYTNKNSAIKCEIDVNGKSVVVVSMHLDWVGYASNLPRGYNTGSKSYKGWKMIEDANGKPKPVTDIKTILAVNGESLREKQIEEVIKSVEGVHKPVILLGDFNEPSFFDWTEKTKNMFAHNGVVIEWPVTKILHRYGFTDAYRTFYPDEVKNPGITWPSKCGKSKITTWAPKSDDRDRIDYIFYKGDGLKLKSVSIVGPKASFAYKKLTKEKTENESFLAQDIPWPSDHKGLFAEFDLK
jgi:endonuclease/exonuclease/phosphatase family metal-dependent hydrolase